MTYTAARCALVATLATTLAACGGGSPGSGRIGPQGGVVSTSSGFTLSIPAGALSRELEIQVNDAPPKDGATHRFELEPRDLPLAAKARISMKHGADDGPMKLVEVQGEMEQELENERENEMEQAREAEVEHLGVIEMRHQRVCAVACDAGFECDDGACKPHPEDAAATAVCAPACTAGFHCEAGACVADPNDAVPPPPGSCPPGMELDPSDGTCKAHGGTGP